MELRNQMMKDQNSRHAGGQSTVTEMSQSFKQQLGMTNDLNAETAVEAGLQTEKESSNGPPRKDDLLGKTSNLDDDDDFYDDILGPFWALKGPKGAPFGPKRAPGPWLAQGPGTQKGPWALAGPGTPGGPPDDDDQILMMIKF